MAGYKNVLELTYTAVKQSYRSLHDGLHYVMYPSSDCADSLAHMSLCCLPMWEEPKSYVIYFECYNLHSVRSVCIQSWYAKGTFSCVGNEQNAYIWYLQIRRHFCDVNILINMDDMLILIIYPLRLNLVYLDWNWQIKCKKMPIAIDYNGYND